MPNMAFCSTARSSAMRVAILGWLGLLTSLSLLPIANTFAQTNNSYPMVMSLRPPATQVGTSTDHEVHARYNLLGATEIRVSDPRIQGTVLPDPNCKPEDITKNDLMASHIKVRFQVANDVPPGVYDFRIMTPHGASTLGQLVVARDPIQLEAPDNDLWSQAQAVSLPATLCGAFEKAEDIDCFRFMVEAGSQWTFHTQSQRLLNRLHDMQTRVDPVIELRNLQGNLLASSDNFYAGDPLLHYRFDQAGEYVLVVRDVRYQGNADWTYSIEIDSRPFVTQANPLVISSQSPQPGGLIGHAIPPATQVGWDQLAGKKPGIHWVANTVANMPTNGFPVLVTELPIMAEPLVTSASPTAADGVAPNPSSPMTIQAPGMIAGTIAHASEVDRYRLEAKAQQRISFEVYARRLQSGMDPVLRIRNESGALLAEVDDSTYDRVQSSDPELENWSAPADGVYWVEVTDLHERGGADCVYALEVLPAQPYFKLELDTDKTLLAPGMSSVLFVRGLRHNGFNGEIELSVEDLPAGVEAVCGRILANGNDGCILFRATTAVPNTMANIRVLGKGIDPQSGNSLVSYGNPLQEYYSPGGGRGNYPVIMHSLSIANPMDVRKISMSQSEVKLKPGGSQRIEVTVERAPDFRGNVTLDVLLQHLEQPFGNTLPAGVKLDVANSKTLLTASDTVGYITLVAAPDAPAVTRQLVPLNVHVSINFVMKHTFCGDPLWVSIERE